MSVVLYSIPSNNPFVSGGGLPEIYAYGLRNHGRHRSINPLEIYG
jgi:hypothetical protein